MYWFFPGKMLPCTSALHWARLRTWFVMCSGRSSILHYGPLIETNFLYGPTPNGQSPSASLNKSNTPQLFSKPAPVRKQSVACRKMELVVVNLGTLIGGLITLI